MRLAVPHIPGSSGSHSRELTYYRDKVDDLGRRLNRAQEAQARTQRELWQSQLVVSVLRDFSRQTGMGGTAEEYTSALASKLINSDACDGSVFLREVGQNDVFHPGFATGALTVLSQESLTLVRVPEFVCGRDSDPELRFLQTWIGSAASDRSFLWSFEPESGFAILMSRDPSSPFPIFDAGDKEIATSALACLASAYDTVSYAVDPGMPGTNPLQLRSDIPHNKNGGIYELEIRRLLARGTTIKAIIAVERSVSDDVTELVPYLLFKDHYQVLNLARRQSALGWRAVNSFFKWIRKSINYHGVVRVLPQGSPELRLIAGILAEDRRLPGGQIEIIEDRPPAPPLAPGGAGMSRSTILRGPGRPWG